MYGTGDVLDKDAAEVEPYRSSAILLLFFVIVTDGKG